jgi:predicted pyridoxine 5'-phosphate oxidase superfamily flavin-nucleotide-binding protein
MGRRFAELAFTSKVKEQQQLHDSREQYEHVEQTGRLDSQLGPQEKAFIQQRDEFYIATVSETGWPYIQYRGGARGFLHVVDDRTLGFADLRGNKQYISIGNLQHDSRVALFLMDYPAQRRLKIFGRARIHEGDQKARELIQKLNSPDETTPAERAIMIDVEAFDWNCPQHITPRYTQEELIDILAPMRARLRDLEAENAELRKSRLKK